MVTDLHREAAAALLEVEFDALTIRRNERVERIASRLAELEAKAKTVAITERQIVGSTDRWLRIDKTSPSGKALFVCRSCGAVSPAPNKTCPEPVTLWSGAMRACGDWVPPKDLLPGPSVGLLRAIELLTKKLYFWPPFNEGYGFGRSFLKELREELKKTT